MEVNENNSNNTMSQLLARSSKSNWIVARGSDQDNSNRRKSRDSPKLLSIFINQAFKLAMPKKCNYLS
ncbi:hypothetical protein DFA_08620 [Cavenderia fasciculata]|uniref:Uncharacterized protein n=1 Tax=Cavenderia fasciculata TaxID=261658 RepID=F4Q3B4_CACFS|nr:uncharacterized protein DFA_08620 [Cavenderia fasciculata]EGG17624.1 hypothetical protein DFA_08620 [Cavenderia fasciculata]|eukprot:XP_004356108.1 hypothetical protein DFA_08620 [Cavenderia fasciculata]